ncbi:MAG: ABC transporter permease subunit [Alphaproteobacteria bacterium]|nr:ABC transporter permease subunit [Alphaproteobacteria bacterium]MCB9796557.1 ABC transporter permease subunit [Alphaproteobacteria bacterium]
MSSLWDTLAVTRLQLSRALRTRSALLLCAIYALMAGASAYGFTRLLLLLETQTARTLGAPTTETPGAMLGTLKADPDFQDLLNQLTGDPELLQWALDTPFLTVTAFWTGLAALPFFAAMLGAEAIAADTRSRALRFELLRTGRPEILLGRLGGQALLIAAALAFAALATWIVAMTAMTGNAPLEQALSLLALGPRLWVWSLPFLGLGLAASQSTANVNLARVMAIGGVAASWVVYARLETWAEEGAGALTDALSPLLPQSWALDLWGPGLGWTGGGAVLLAMGLAFAMAALPLLRWRDL